MFHVKVLVSLLLKSMLMATVVLLASCATLSTSSVEGLVAERVNARYAALVESKYEVAYGFFTPAFRDLWTYREYLSSRPPVVTYSEAKLLSVKCKMDEVCAVEVEVVYRPVSGIRGVPNNLDLSRINEEKWIQVEGQWWLYQSE